MLYDTSLDPDANRPVGPHLSKLIDVGTAVLYPPNITLQDPNSDIPQEDINHVTSDFYWAPDSSAFVFSDEQEVKPAVTPAKTAVKLVLINVLPPNTPMVGVYQLDTCQGVWCQRDLENVNFSATGIKGVIKGFGDFEGKKWPVNVGCNQFQTP